MNGWAYRQRSSFVRRQARAHLAAIRADRLGRRGLADAAWPDAPEATAAEAHPGWSGAPPADAVSRDEPSENASPADVFAADMPVGELPLQDDEPSLPDEVTLDAPGESSPDEPQPDACLPHEDVPDDVMSDASSEEPEAGPAEAGIGVPETAVVEPPALEPDVAAVLSSDRAAPDQADDPTLAEGAGSAMVETAEAHRAVASPEAATADALHPRAQVDEVNPADAASAEDPRVAAEAPADPAADEPPQASAPTADDLAELPGAGPGLVWMLRSVGIESLSDLAAADSASLGARLGTIATILDLDYWIDFAKARRPA